jgi:hypothetical protein
MTIEATFTNMFRREGGRQTRSAPETKPEVAVQPKQEQDVSPAAKPIPSAPESAKIPWTQEPVWKVYGLDVSETVLD